MRFYLSRRFSSRKALQGGHCLFRFLAGSGNAVIALVRLAGASRARLFLAAHQIRAQLIRQPLFLAVQLVLSFLIDRFFAHKPCLLREKAPEKRLDAQLSEDFHIM